MTCPDPAPDAPLRWDLFGRVVDNLGDVGVCWRLACALAEAGDRVRLVLDDASALAWMAPGGRAGVTVCGWPGPVGPPGHGAPPGDALVETFGCDLPAAARAALREATVARGAAAAPAWLDVEHLSAEPYVERSHARASPQADGCVRWFWFPGFTRATGGLLREADLDARLAAVDAAGRTAHGVPTRPGERAVLLFAYDSAPLAAALPALAAAGPVALLVPPGPPTRLVEAAARAGGWPAGVRVQPLPWLPQTAFDALLRGCDAAFVRGEDSLVRALWAGVPFVWQAYRQHDGAHTAKVEALLATLALPPDAAAWWRFWNRAPDAPATAPPWPATARWRDAVRGRAAALAAQPDLVGGLRAFVRARRAASPSAAPGGPPGRVARRGATAAGGRGRAARRC